MGDSQGAAGAASDREDARGADQPVADQPPEPEAEAPIEPEPEPTEDSEEQEYDTWLGRLEQEWDPTQTGTEDAWSRAAPQVDPPPDAPASIDASAAEDQTDRTDEERQPATAAPEETEQPEPEQPALQDTAETRGLDTGISYIEAWAEDLLAEVERAEKESADDGDGKGPGPAEAEAGQVEASPERPSEEESAAPPEPDAGTAGGPVTMDQIPAEAEGTRAATVDPPSSAVTEARTDQQPLAAGPEASDAHPPETPADGKPAKKPETVEWVAVGEPSPDLEPVSGEAAPSDEPETGPGDKWLEETWATDTQSFQPEAWLEPDFVEQEPLPEKLEGAGAESEVHATSDDHAATDPAIPPETGPGQSEAAEIAGLWPDFDGDAEVEEIVLESEEPAAPDPDTPPDKGGPPADAGGGATAGSQPVPGSGTSDGAAAIAAAGTVQAAAVRVTTASEPAEDRPLSDEEAASTMALKAEEVARELGLPRNRPLLKWSSRVLGLLVLLGLIAAGVHWQRGVLMRNASLAPILEKAYGIIGIPVQPQWDVTAFDIVDSAARSTGEDLVVVATFVNEAEFAQPYPVLRVTLENRWGQAIGQEDFTPRNYLRSFIAGRRMDAGERSRVEVILRSPGSAAEGFSVDVCLASSKGALQCLSDRP
ncbi:MAG: DUF3426 domain-containing protein [Gammaproteobacteria bacterium]